MKGATGLGALAALLVALTASACKKAPETETLLIAGSSTVRGYLDPVVKAFVAKNPSANVVNEGGGSTAGLVALKHGAVDLATLARPITAAEDEVSLRDYLVARDGVAIVVNPANPVNDLSMKQLARIYEGQVQNWKDVGGADAPILAVEREKTSHVRKSFQDLVLGGEDPTASVRTVANAAELQDAVKGTPGAIGYITLHKLGPGVKTLHIEGVELSRVTMLSGRYPLSRSFYLAVRGASPLAERFLDFTLSKDGQDILAADGLLETF